MATTLMPIDPATSPQRVLRVLAISANLLPAEIVAARRARRTRGWVLVVLVLVVALLASWYFYAAQQKKDADKQLASLSTAVTSLQRKQNKDFADVVSVQSQTATLDKQLKTVMTDDLPWATLLSTLLAAASDAGVELTGITGSLNAGTTGASTAGTALPSNTGAATIGTLMLSGTAPDKPSVAAFVVRLGKLTTVANPYLTSAAETDEGVLQYSLQVDITNASLCGRFTTPCKTGGK